MDPLMDSRMGGSSANEDMNYTADISTQMRIPDRLSFARSLDGFAAVAERAAADGSDRGDETAAGMQLPDKIIVAGAERHIELSGGMCDPFPADILGEETTLRSSPFGVTAPPSVLRVDEARFPEMTLQDEENADAILGRGRKSQKGRTSELTALSRTNQSDSDFFEDENLYQLQQQFSRLQRRVDRLEADAAFTHQRDRIMLPLLGAYALYKIIRFLFQPRA